MSAPRFARWKRLATILGLLAVVEAVSVALIIVETARLDGRGTAYAAIEEEYRRDPAGFADWSARLLADGARRTSLAHMEASPAASVTDLVSALRVVTTLRGRLDDADGVVRDTELEYREFYHAGGLDLLNSDCPLEGDACAARDRLVAEAERRLLARLGESGAAGLLPDGGRCEAVGDSDDERARTHTCLYPQDVLITLRRDPEIANRERLQMFRGR